jgi:uncharacterized membrane protein
MLQKIKKMILVVVASSTLLAPGLVPALAGTALAANNINTNLCKGVNQAADPSGGGGCDTAGNGTEALGNIASKAVNIFSLIVGIVAVIMIIYGGFRYITSGGDSNNVGTAKNTLIYAIVGLIIVALAQFIVHYVLSTATNAVPNQ